MSADMEWEDAPPTGAADDGPRPPCPQCGSDVAVLRAARVPVGTEVRVTTTVLKTVHGLDHEPAAIAEQHEEVTHALHFDIRLKNAHEARRYGGLQLLISVVSAVFCIAAIHLGNKADGAIQAVAGILGGVVVVVGFTTFISAVMALSAPRQDKRDAYLAKAQAAHEHAWLCARCHCLYFEDGHTPEGIEPLTAVPWAAYKQRLWRSAGYRNDVDR